MINMGTVRPGSTIRIPFSTFDKDDGSSITQTNFAVGDILIYKDGSTTERASTSGFTATTDFDSKTGKQLIVIDLADNTTAGFYAAGSEYLVAVDAVTVDTVTTGGWVARFTIGYDGAWFDTTIATLASQTSFTLTAGPAEDDALNGQWVIIHDVASAVQCGRALILDYTGSTKTVTLAAGTTFTAAAGDNISIMGMAPLQPGTIGRTITVDTSGRVLTGNMKRTSTAQAGSAASGNTAATLTLDASATAAHCERGDVICIVSGTGAGNSNIVTGFDATTKVADMLQDWSAAGTPNNTSVFEVYAIGGVVPSLQADIADAVGDNVRDGAAVPADVTYVRGTALVGAGTAGDRVRLTGLPGDVP